MTAAQILAFLQPFVSIIEPMLMNLEAEGIAELNTIIAGVSSPDLKLGLQALATAADAFAKTEIGKLGV